MVKFRLKQMCECFSCLTGALRLTLQGKREVILVREKLLVDHLGPGTTLKLAKQALLGMDEVLAGKLQPFICTVSKAGCVNGMRCIQSMSMNFRF